ncbi:MAG: (deoxy)nucleoside triphosphate pyrophosphohydrolase [Deltaproteobacteria bacterium]|nr:(deoxy)nucleoside triphosphate pyrophosphohydrolase [Deltaproteobacteria bacterium]
MMKVTAAILERNGKVLICRRPQNKTLGGLWEFPGGKIEAEESPKDCLKRELQEELGIEQADIGEYLGTYHYHGLNNQIELYAYRVPYPHGQIALHEHEDAKWIKINDHIEFEFAPIDEDIIDTLLITTLE